MDSSNFQFRLATGNGGNDGNCWKMMKNDGNSGNCWKMIKNEGNCWEMMEMVGK